MIVRWRNDDKYANIAEMFLFLSAVTSSARFEVAHTKCCHGIRSTSGRLVFDKQSSNQFDALSLISTRVITNLFVFSSFSPSLSPSNTTRPSSWQSSMRWTACSSDSMENSRRNAEASIVGHKHATDHSDSNSFSTRLPCLIEYALSDIFIAK